jgi:hypothetical protein
MSKHFEVALIFDKSAEREVREEWKHVTVTGSTSVPLKYFRTHDWFHEDTKESKMFLYVRTGHQSRHHKGQFGLSVSCLGSVYRILRKDYNL